MKCIYKAKVIRHDNSEHNVEGSFEVSELLAWAENVSSMLTKDNTNNVGHTHVFNRVLLSEYVIRCHALVDNFPLGNATGTDNVTITDWELLL